ncbi:hypothetical protein XENOCAPTIV_016897 [Xenoophorus captivus]|uniref:Flocculation protein FLO11-like n=1 Tax=Xenoophorus captivus TaxID=1517983 RepID=A0ABV0SHT0_9TELE
MDSGGGWVSYDTAFPARPTLALFSPLPGSPSSSTPNVPLHTHTAHLDVFSTWDEEYDPEDMMPLEPTEVLLPDMNSLEYYTNLLAREKEREKERLKEREQEEHIHQTKSRPSITPLKTQTHHSPLTPVPTLRGPPTELDHKHPPKGPNPPLTPSPALTNEKSPTLPKISQTTSSPAPPSNTTGQVSPAPPMRPSARPGRPERPSVMTEKIAKTPAIMTTTQITSISLTRGTPVTTPKGAHTPLTRQYLCNVTKPELYLVRVVSAKGSSAGFSHVRDVLRKEFNRSVELQTCFLTSFLFQFLRTPSSFAFRVVSGPMIYTAISVINALRQSPRSSGPIPTVSPLYTIPDLGYQIHSVLQFVPTHVDIRVCNFTERVERGLMMAYAESQRRSHEAGNSTVQLLNITMGIAWPAVGQKVPVDITFAVRDGKGYLPGSEVSEHLRKLSLVEFSFYVGFPALQIAERHTCRFVLRSLLCAFSVLLGVHEQQVAERSFKARLERRLALLLEEGLQQTSRRRWKRATAVGNNSLQV